MFFYRLERERDLRYRMLLRSLQVAYDLWFDNGNSGGEHITLKLHSRRRNTSP